MDRESGKKGVGRGREAIWVGLVGEYSQAWSVGRGEVSFLILLLIFLLACTGVHRRRGGEPEGALVGVRGERVLVQVMGGEGEGEGIGEAERRVATLPFRAILADRQEDSYPTGLVERARRERIPFVLLLEWNASQTKFLWKWLSPWGTLPEAMSKERLFSSARALEAELRGELSGREEKEEGWRIAPPDEIHRLWGLRVVGGGEVVTAAAAALAEKFPRDPAPRALLASPPPGGNWLDQKGIHAFHPLGESPFSEGCRVADSLSGEEVRRWAGECWLGLRAAFPERWDYLLPAVEAVGRWKGDEAALALLVAGAPSREPEEGKLATLSLPMRARWAGEGDRRLHQGVLLAGLSRVDPAVASFLRAVRLFRELELAADMALALNEMGVVLVDAERFAEALSPLREAVDLHRESGPSSSLATSLFNLGMAYGGVGREMLADQHLSRAVRQYASLGEESAQFDTLLELMAVRGRRKDEVDLRAAAREAESLLGGSPDRRGRMLEARGLALTELGEEEEALVDLAAAEQTFSSSGDRLGVGRIYYDQAIPLLSLGRREEALAALEKARSIAVELGDTESVVIIDAQMGKIREGMK